MDDRSTPRNSLRELHDRSHVRLLASDVVRIGTWWNFTGVCSSFWRLYINSGPGSRVVWSGGHHDLTPGVIHLLPPWLAFGCQHEATEITHLYIHFDLIGPPATAARRALNRPVALVPDAVIGLLIDNCRVAMGRNEHDRFTTITCIQSLVHLALRQLACAEPAVGQAIDRALVQNDARISDTLHYIEQHLRAPLSNNILAEQTGLSMNQFVRVFHATIGQTPARYVLERRIAAAAERLAYGSESLDHIAAEFNFANRFHFSRAFRRIMGQPPATYRRGPHV